MDETDQKEKVSSLQAVVCTGPSEPEQAELLFRGSVPKSQQGGQPEKMAEQTGKQGIFQRA